MADFRRLQRLINAAAKAATASFDANTDLYNECQRRYGYIPSDVLADEIIDAVLGGCGSASGMDARKFDDIMRQLAPKKDQPTAALARVPAIADAKGGGNG